MLKHKNTVKAIILIFLFQLLFSYNLKAAPTEEFEVSPENNVKSEIKNHTIGSWWMWASGSGLLVLLIFAFSKEEEGFSIK